MLPPQAYRHSAQGEYQYVLSSSLLWVVLTKTSKQKLLSLFQLSHSISDFILKRKPSFAMCPVCVIPSSVLSISLPSDRAGWAASLSCQHAFPGLSMFKLWDQKVMAKRSSPWKGREKYQNKEQVNARFCAHSEVEEARKPCGGAACCSGSLHYSCTHNLL